MCNVVENSDVPQLAQILWGTPLGTISGSIDIAGAHVSVLPVYPRSRCIFVTGVTRESRAAS